jgi:hypothetical protein
MKLLQFILLTATGGLALTSFACDYPPLVPIPDGQTATLSDMVAARQAVDNYMAAMQDYLDCLNDELVATGDNAPAEYKAIMYNRHVTAYAELEAVAGKMNEQIDVFYQANPDIPRPGGATTAPGQPPTGGVP